MLGLGFAAGWILREEGAPRRRRTPRFWPRRSSPASTRRWPDGANSATCWATPSRSCGPTAPATTGPTYLSRPPSYSAYKLGDIRAFQAGDVLTATYFAGVTGTIEDTGIASEDQPRLVVFTRANGEWKLQGSPISAPG